jgi:tRNA-(ms[2]io[6]A)-hydroxylase
MPVAVVPSTRAWVEAACRDLPTLLIDHAHCEKKAASTAVRFLFKYPEWASLRMAMSRLAREELVHFERVLKELDARGVPFRALKAANYATHLFAACRPGSAVDEMLACALIEARSHERFERLAEALGGASGADARLAAFYRELGEAEARHGELYVELANEANRGPVEDRLTALVAREAEIVARPGQLLRMHAGG